MLEFEESDKLFIGNKILKEFGDCLSCGLCCKLFPSIELYPEEIKLIRKYLNIDKKQLAAKYIRSDKSNNVSNKILLKTPCPFQENNQCKIHEVKPFDCKTFPFIINFTRQIAILNGIYVCPQATQFYEGFLEFCKINNPSTYDAIFINEKNTKISKLGMKLKIDSKNFISYIDWIYSNKKR
jgi:Fe-S-cluster containining protein